jgi:hypothetical protein
VFLDYRSDDLIYVDNNVNYLSDPSIYASVGCIIWLMYICV